MKKILFAACMAGMVLLNAVKSQAQFWGGAPGTVTTTTAGNCSVGGNLGLGGNANIATDANIGNNAYIVKNASIGINAHDARLQIENTAYVDATSPYNMGEIKIHRTTNPGPTPPPFYVAPNVIDITRTQNLHTPYTTSTLFTLTDGGYVGIGLSNPGYQLDVAGDIHCSANATVGGDIYITHSNDALWRNIFANANSTGLALYSKSTTLDGPAIMMTGNSATSFAGDMRFFDGSSGTARFVFGKPSGSANGMMTEQVVIDGNGDISMPRDNDVDWRSISGKADHSALIVKGADNNSGTIELYGGQHTDRPGRLQFISDDAGDDPDGLGFNFINYDPVNTWQSRMRIYKNGKVAIGAEGMNIATSYGYGLYVEKGVLTSRLKVAVTNSTEWSDYVFADNYKLKPLSDVAAYINDNKHLPGVPSASDVAKDGVDVAQMDATLLKKIEELTLYSIQQQKLIEQMQKEMADMKKELGK